MNIWTKFGVLIPGPFMVDPRQEKIVSYIFFSFHVSILIPYIFLFPSLYVHNFSILFFSSFVDYIFFPIGYIQSLKYAILVQWQVLFIVIYIQEERALHKFILVAQSSQLFVVFCHM